MSSMRLLTGEGDGRAFCRELLSRLMFQFDVLVPEKLSVSMPIVLDWPGLCAIWFGTPKACSRWILDGLEDDHSAIFLLSDELFATVHGQGIYARLKNQTALLFVNAVRTATDDQIEHTLLIVQNTAFVSWEGQMGRAVTRLVPRDVESLRFLTKYVKILRESSALITVDLRRSILVHIRDLIALAVGVPQDTLLIASERSVRSARLRAIKNYVLRNLDDPQMTVSAIAIRQGVTARYIHMLFEAEKLTFSTFVLAQRLLLAHRMLSDPRCDALTVTNVAFSVGFGDLSYFDRAFRRRFGRTPSEQRRPSNRLVEPAIGTQPERFVIPAR